MLLAHGYGVDVIGVDRRAVVQKIFSRDDARAARDAEQIVVLGEHLLVLHGNGEVAAVGGVHVQLIGDVHELEIHLAVGLQHVQHAFDAPLAIIE